jgi:excisionase family DNA binding protein
MSFEETLTAVLQAQLAPVLAEIRQLRERIKTFERKLPPLLGTKEDAARVLGTSASTIRRRIEDGSIPATKKGGLVRVDLAALNPVDEAELEKLLKNRREKP